MSIKTVKSVEKGAEWTSWEWSVRDWSKEEEDWLGGD